MDLPVLPSATPIPADLLGSLSPLSLAATAAFALASAALWATRVPPRARLLFFLAVGVALRLCVAVRDPVALMQWPTSDDSYYYFSIARNVAAGEGLRHDSFHTTTGFQPLFLALITPIFALAGSGAGAIRGVLLLQTAVAAGWVLCLAGLARHLGSDRAGAGVVAAWSVSPLLLSTDLNGLETGTALLATCATLRFYAARFARDPTPGPGACAVLGAACGLCFLARVDAGLLGLALGLDVARRGAARGGARAQLSRLAALGGAAAVVASPWILYNAVEHGGILPTSGRAVRVLSQAFGFRFVDGGHAWPGDYFEIGRIPAAWLLGTARNAVALLPRLGHQVLPLWAGGLALLAAAALAPRDLRRRAGPVAPYLAFLLLLFAAYAGYVFGPWFFGRYLIHFGVAYLLLASLAGAALERVAWPPRARRGVKLGAAAVLSGALGLSLLGSLAKIEEIGTRPPSRHYRAALWANEKTPDDAVIGSFQAGILGFHLERRFHALDGKVNRAAVRALAEGTMDRYAVEHGLDYVMDQRWVLRDLFAQRSRDPGFLARQERVATGHYDVFRLRR